MKKQLAEVVDGIEINDISEQEILYSCENNGAKDLCSTKKDATRRSDNSDDVLWRQG